MSHIRQDVASRIRARNTVLFSVMLVTLLMFLVCTHSSMSSVPLSPWSSFPPTHLLSFLVVPASLTCYGALYDRSISFFCLLIIFITLPRFICNSCIVVFQNRLVWVLSEQLKRGSRFRSQFCSKISLSFIRFTLVFSIMLAYNRTRGRQSDSANTGEYLSESWRFRRIPVHWSAWTVFRKK